MENEKLKVIKSEPMHNKKNGITAPRSLFPDVVELNVGGRHFTTSVETLTRCKGSILEEFFTGDPEILPRDKDGRFFIDADGTIFTHVLNFLRSSQLPPRDIAETVYKEALVWGLGELISALEAVPPVMIKICKENTRNVIPGYKKFISSLTEWISDDCKENVRGKTTVYIALQEADNGESEAENFYQNHICFGLHEVTKSKVNADLYFGPWRTAIQATGNEMIGFVVSDLTEKGFEVFDSGLVRNQCQYFRHSGEAIKCCRRHLFYLTVQWWSNPFKSSRSKKVNFAIDN